MPARWMWPLSRAVRSLRGKHGKDSREAHFVCALLFWIWMMSLYIGLSFLPEGDAYFEKLRSEPIVTSRISFSFLPSDPSRSSLDSCTYHGVPGRVLRQVSAQPCVQIVLAAEDAYLNPLLAAINSIRMYTERSLYLHVIVGRGETSFFRDRVSFLNRVNLSSPIHFEVIELNEARVSSLVKVWSGKQRLESPLNFIRFFLPELLPGINRVVYLDPDTLAVSDVGDLFDFLDTRRNSTHFLAAVAANQFRKNENYYNWILNCKSEYIKAIIPSCRDHFFNAGVFVTELDGWRGANITRTLEAYMRVNLRTRLWRWGSQAPLALAFYRRWIPLDKEWNFRRVSTYLKRGYKAHQVVTPPRKLLHFTGRWKPWEKSERQMHTLWCTYFPYPEEYSFCAGAELFTFPLLGPDDIELGREEVGEEGPAPDGTNEEGKEEGLDGA
mmetsp:Transcript_49772/g.125119  ORF Transcript_49772/g.125119 Transcript_49772/m.125119 type:complete len:440 (-) Transcript_49772:1527-2846(-)